MRVFAYEHVTGGGLSDQPGIAALAPEAELMLRALVHDLLAVPGVEVSVLRDPRLTFGLPAPVCTTYCTGELWPAFRRALSEADAAWPIAPEQGGVLERLSREILDGGRRLLGSRPDAVALTASKLRTAQALAAAGVNAIPAYADEAGVPPGVQRIVVKPEDGAGCQETYLFDQRAALQAWLRQHGAAGRVLQPFVDGEPLSLSVLCCERGARLLACNRQHVRVSGGTFEFSGVSVNALADLDGRYARLARAVVRALPGLWGYIGIDVIAAPDGLAVVEVNPRLTTSYAGLRAALGVNAAGLVLGLPCSVERAAGATPGRAVEVSIAHA
jgi:tyramine---L-glutamate ligase